MPISFAYENPLRSRFNDAFFATLPEAPGVYFMHAADGSLLYIGKAASLRARVSSYRAAKPGAVGENIIELLEHVREIRWKGCRTEAQAIQRETELIRAIRPPYNLANTFAEHYLFIGLELPGCDAALRPARFRLSSHDTVEDGVRLFGCYKDRRLTKSGYSALLRLLHAGAATGGRFSFPARICRASPAYTWATELPAAWIDDLAHFLEGRSARLLRAITEAMLANESIPPFMYPAIQDDLELARAFYRRGPRFTRELRRATGHRGRVLSKRRMDELVAAILENERVAS